MVYKREYPVDLVISEQCLDKYNAVFFFLLRLKRLSSILSHLWRYLSTQEFKVCLATMNICSLEAASNSVLKDQACIDA